MIDRPLVLSLRGADVRAIIDAACASGWLPTRTPDAVKAERGTGAWQERFAQTGTGAMVTWGKPDDPDASVAHDDGCTVIATRDDPARDPVLERLEALPFTVAVFARLYREWGLPPPGYRAPSFGSSMSPHGWACAFRGTGHDRLVSRRWLRYGPWRLHERPDDLSIVEFHDPAADPATALAQARPGHARMGITDGGGYIQPNFVYKEAPRGFYEEATGLLKVVVAGRPLSQRELLEACALRIETRPVQPGRVSNVAYVFMEETEATQNLHELWLRGLECRAMRLGKEVRLDAEYAPVPAPPAWARPR